MLLEARDLAVRYRVPGAELAAVRGLDLDVARGETLGLVGESGCGKTTVTRALLGLLPMSATVTGSLRLEDRELVGLPEPEFETIRGRRIALVPQGAMSALNPVLSVGDQVAEAAILHRALERDDARALAGELFTRVGLDPGRRRHYPHEFSGGMRQRVAIAIALAGGADVVVADEPTTGLDVLVQAQILELLMDLKAELGLTLVLVSHDLRVVLRTCDRVAVMYAGQVVETAPADELRERPRHPYTTGLLAALPRIGLHERRWISIPGAPPDLRDPPAGCGFHPRCAHARDECRTTVPPPFARGGTQVACHLYAVGEPEGADLLPTAEPAGSAPRPAHTHAPSADRANGAPLLEVAGLTKTFSRRDGFGRRSHIHAVDHVDVTLGRGEVLGLIGRSGSGKSTVARCLLRLVEPSSGRIRLGDLDVTALRRGALREYRHRVAMVHQDPYESLHPGMRVVDLVAEPLKIAGLPVRHSRVEEALAACGITPNEDLLRRFPSQLSGGQRQRVALARALAPEPELLLADEPTSMLDVSVRAGIIATLERLRDEFGLAILLITHDLAEAFHLCDRIVVLLEGQVAEAGPASQVATEPLHPYTQALLAAAEDPLGVPTERAEEDAGEGGCPYRLACPLAEPMCTTHEPALAAAGAQRAVACHVVAGDHADASRAPEP